MDGQLGPPWIGFILCLHHFLLYAKYFVISQIIILMIIPLT